MPLVGGEHEKPVNSSRNCLDVGWRCEVTVLPATAARQARCRSKQLDFAGRTIMATKKTPRTKGTSEKAKKVPVPEADQTPAETPTAESTTTKPKRTKKAATPKEPKPKKLSAL